MYVRIALMGLRGQCLCRLPMGVYLSITGTTHIGLALRTHNARTSTECTCASRSWATTNFAEIGRATSLSLGNCTWAATTFHDQNVTTIRRPADYNLDRILDCNLEHHSKKRTPVDFRTNGKLFSKELPNDYLPAGTEMVDLPVFF